MLCYFRKILKKKIKLNFKNYFDILLYNYKREIQIMARPKGAKDIFPRVTKKQLEAWPDASQFVFDDWVLELLAELPEEPEEVYVHKEKISRGRRGNPIEIDGVIYDNAIEASRFLYVSNTTIHNWLRNGKAKRI